MKDCGRGDEDAVRQDRGPDGIEFLLEAIGKAAAEHEKRDAESRAEQDGGGDDVNGLDEEIGVRHGIRVREICRGCASIGSKLERLAVREHIF